MDRIALLMQDLGIGSVPVVDEDRLLLGIVNAAPRPRWPRLRPSGGATRLVVPYA